MIARVVIAVMLAAGTAASAPSVAELEREVRAHPDDVDRRLQLATALSWADRRDDARREALAVLSRAPSYVDATLLLARLDAWDRRWRDARTHVERVLAAQPAHVEARLLAVDIALWSGDLGAARSALAAAGGAGEVDILYRRAQLALAERHHRRALALANRIIALDPEHAGARALGAAIRMVSVESATDTEVYPRMYRDRFAVGETLTASIFPLARWSATFVYEYRRRFATDNHRVGARADWRPTPRWSVIAFARGGSVEVVPRFTTFAEARWDRDGWVAGGRYTYDRMPWAGDLHRAQVTGGAPLSARLRVEGDAMVGTLRGCDASTAVWSARVRLAWLRGRWGLGGGYGYGLEADRALVGSDPCASPTRDLVDHDVHAGGIDVTRTLWHGLSVRLGYGVELRASDTVVHLGSFAVRAWF